MPARILHTIGYEKAGASDFLATLQRAGIATLVDVRDLPLSRRAGFSKRQLEAAMAAAGIGYVHLKALGTPPEGREANRQRNWPRFWDIVEARLAGRDAELALQQAAGIAGEGPSCLVCYEADWCICHRRRVAEILQQRHGFAIRHLRVHPG